MTRSWKQGITSAVLLGISFVPPFSNCREPLDFAFVSVSAVLGLPAAQQGSKWWLVIPRVIVAGFAVVLDFAAHSFRFKQPTTLGHADFQTHHYLLLARLCPDPSRS